MKFHDELKILLIISFISLFLDIYSCTYNYLNLLEYLTQNLTPHF